jgi:glycosyltransferase involved in cell wall biosynthesis
MGSALTAKRLLFVTQAAHVGGGVENWLEQTARIVSGASWEVHVGLARGCFHDPGRFLRHHSLPNPHVLGDSRGLREGRIASIAALIERVRPDVLIPVQLADALLAGAMARKRTRLRLVVCLHGHDPRVLEDTSHFASHIDLAVSPSRRLAAWLASATSLGPERVAHIPVSVAAPVTPPVARRQLKQVAVVGRLDNTEKRVFDLPPLVPTLRQLGVRLQIAGDGPDRSRLQEMLGPNIPSGLVCFHGLMPRAEVCSRIYPMADALLLLSPAEAGPVTAWEAMRHGVVPVVSDFVGRREEGVLVDDMNCLVFPVGDVEAAGRALIDLSEERRIRRLSAAAASTLPEEYCLERSGLAWVAALERCLAGRRAESGVVPRIPPSPGVLAGLRLGLTWTLGLRRLLGRSFRHEGPGAEWPHAYGEWAEAGRTVVRGTS